MKQVRETAAGRSISAYVVINPKGDHVATVQAHFANSGGVLVNVWTHGDKAAARVVKGLGLELDESGRIAKGKHKGAWPYEAANQSGHAGGYGYDKFTAALSYLNIDGHMMSDHCGQRAKPPRGLSYFPADYKPAKGYSLANYGKYDATTGKRLDSFVWRNQAEKELGEGAPWEAVKAREKEIEAAAVWVAGYDSCYRVEGLNYLSAIGYHVIQAI